MGKDSDDADFSDVVPPEVTTLPSAISDTITHGEGMSGVHTRIRDVERKDES